MKLKPKKTKKKSSKDLEITRKRLAKLAVLNKKIALSLSVSEVRYRRLFESAKDGILILDAETGRITDVNPFLIDLLGHSRNDFLGKRLWEIGLFGDMERSKKAFRELQKNGYIRYEDIPLETKDRKRIDVEFVSNVYQAGKFQVIQCNIRDITDRKHAEVEKAILKTIEREQQRIGQDLHDGLCQQLTGIALLAHALAKKLGPEEAKNAVEIADLTNQAINQTRELARGLAPVEFDSFGLIPALQKFSASIERLYSISCSFETDKNMELGTFSALVATHLYLITQEAVNNAVKHGKSKRVVINLTDKAGSDGLLSIRAENEGVLLIKDNGVGFSPKAEEKKGMGLRSMRYRCETIGARLDIYRDDDGWTVVSCAFPHKSQQESKLQ